MKCSASIVLIVIASLFLSACGDSEAELLEKQKLEMEKQKLEQEKKQKENEKEYIDNITTLRW